MTADLKCPRCGNKTPWVIDETGGPGYCDPCQAYVQGLVDLPVDPFDAEPDDDDD